MGRGKVTLTASRTMTLSSRHAGAKAPHEIHSGAFMLGEYARLLGLADAVAETSDPARRSNAADRAWRVLGDACGYTSETWPVVRELARLPRNLMMVRAGMRPSDWEQLAQHDAQLLALVRRAVGLDFATTQVQDARARPPLIRGINQIGEGFAGMTLDDWWPSIVDAGGTAERLAEVARDGDLRRRPTVGPPPSAEESIERLGATLEELSR